MNVLPMTAKGQVLIPKATRQRFGLVPGRKVILVDDGDELIIRPAPEDPIAAACGFLTGDYSLTEELIAEHRRELAHERR